MTICANTNYNLSIINGYLQRIPFLKAIEAEERISDSLREEIRKELQSTLTEAYVSFAGYIIGLIGVCITFYSTISDDPNRVGFIVGGLLIELDGILTSILKWGLLFRSARDRAMVDHFNKEVASQANK